MKRVYKWLVERNAFSGIIGSVLFPLILVPLFIWCTKYVGEHYNKVEEEICVNVPNELADYSFQLRFVREGAGGENGEGPLANQDLPLIDKGEINQDQSHNRCRTIAFTRGYGAQFKPFVDLNGKTSLSAEQVKGILEKAHFDLTYDRKPDEENFLFFLFPKSRYKQVRDDRATRFFGSTIVNNFVYR